MSNHNHKSEHNHCKCEHHHHHHHHVKNIKLAFFLNLFFSIFELIGGVFTNSIAIISDAIHDFGDALSIGLAYYLEKKSNKEPDNKFSLGYHRFSILGSFITCTILVIGSLITLLNGVLRLFNPQTINYNGMIIIAIVGVFINGFSVFKTSHHHNHLNEKSINLHLLEDMLGWIIVLIGSILMKFFNITILDSIMTIGLSLFIGINAFKNIISTFKIFLNITPENINIEEIKSKIKAIDNSIEIKELSIWKLSDNINICILKITCNNNCKNNIKILLKEYNIEKIYIEIE